ncbi:MAG: LysR family transcriptional regulator [Methylobacteriaceae bacterium]|nr:LysR family transcriptional regulator [Methylobacteriaceae bacterium]
MSAFLSGLRAFHSVAAAGSFTRAARARGVSQPTLSAQVRALEQAHDVRLFDRVGRAARLTALGQSLFVVTTRLTAAEDEAADLLAATRTLRRGHLRIAADSASHVMPGLARFRAAHPAVTFSLTIGNSSDVLEQVTNYAADVAVTAKRPADPRMHAILLKRDRLVGFLPQRHALGKRRRAPIEALSGCDLVLRERGSVTREVFEARLAAASVKPGALFEAQSREAVTEAVRAGLGVGVVFDSEFRPGDGLTRLVIEGADLDVAEYAVCLEERRRIPLLRGFLETLAAPVSRGE